MLDDEKAATLLSVSHPCPVPGCDTGSTVDHQYHPGDDGYVNLRSLTLTYEEAAILRVALATRTLRETLSPEGRTVLAGLTDKAETVFNAFPKGA